MRTKDCRTTGRIYITPCKDPEKAVEFAFKKLRGIVKNINKWKLDKGYLKRQIKENDKS